MKTFLVLFPLFIASALLNSEIADANEPEFKCGCSLYLKGYSAQIVGQLLDSPAMWHFTSPLPYGPGPECDKFGLSYLKKSLLL